jgi:branched-chain amino acid transport system permease protein
VAIGLNLTLGYANQVSLCHASFFGIGAYTMGLLLAQGWSFWLILPLSGIFAGLFGAVIGFPALKWKDHYLALITIAVNIITFFVMVQESWLTGGPTGVSGITRPSIGPLSFTSDISYYYLAFKAIGLNVLAARGHGISPFHYKLLAFATGAVFAGVGGGLFAPLLRYIAPDAFTFFISLEFLIMIVIGGMGRIEGPIIGAIIVVMGPEVLRMAEAAYLIIYSLILIFVMLFMREGLVIVLDRLREAVPAWVERRK